MEETGDINRLIKYDWVKGKEHYERIHNYLLVSNSEMIPQLDSRVDLREYSMKLAECSETIFSCIDGKDVGACSLYCNREIAFISNISVLKEYIRKGIGSELLFQSIEKARENKCTSIELEVFRSNIGARCFYIKHGFELIPKDEMWETGILKFE